MKLGILVVYLASDESRWILEKHLHHIAETEPFMEYTLYAATNRLAEKHRNILQRHNFVRCVELPLLDERGSAEHGMYLDMLAAHAVSEGCDYVCTFDVDSWPIRDDWIEIAYSLLQKSGHSAAAVLRAENGDTVLPHPLFSFLDAKVFSRPHCRYWLTRASGGQAYSRFLLENDQPGDTGAGIGFFLYESGEDWVRILRSNKKDYHYILGGIYGDFIFHIGAGTRDGLFFRGDEVKWLVRIFEPLARIPVAWRYRPTLLNFARMPYMAIAMRRNRRAFDDIISRLKEDEIGLYEELLGA